MKKSLFPLILLLSIFPLKTLAEKYQIQFPRPLFNWKGELRYAVLEKINNTTWYVRQTTQVVNQITGFSKWWDHDVIFSQICLLEKDGEEVLEDDLQNLKSKDGWDDYSGSISDSCIEGDGGLFQLPENSNIQDYSIEIKWIENDEEQYMMFELTDKHLK